MFGLCLRSYVLWNLGSLVFKFSSLMLCPHKESIPETYTIQTEQNVFANLWFVITIKSGECTSIPSPAVILTANVTSWQLRPQNDAEILTQPLYFLYCCWVRSILENDSVVWWTAGQIPKWSDESSKKSHIIFWLVGCNFFVSYSTTIARSRTFKNSQISHPSIPYRMSKFPSIPNVSLNDPWFLLLSPAWQTPSPHSFPPFLSRLEWPILTSSFRFKWLIASIRLQRSRFPMPLPSLWFIVPLVSLVLRTHL